MNVRITIKNLKAKNLSVRLCEIVWFFQVGHYTVKKALEGESPPVYQRPEKLNPEIVLLKEVMFERVNFKKFKGSGIIEKLKS